jgi:hypothetical protein
LAKNAGKEFEDQWKESYSKTPYLFVRLLDAPKWVNSEESRFTPSNPFDGFQHTIPFIFLLELKSTIGSSFSFNPKKPYEKPEKKTTLSIKPAQAKSLMEYALEKEGVISGLIFNFRPRPLGGKTTENSVYFVHILDLIKFAEENDKGSINEEDCRNIGIKVDQKIKKVKYTYFIEKYSKDVMHMCFEKGHIKPELINKLRNWLSEFEKYEIKESSEQAI